MALLNLQRSTKLRRCWKKPPRTIRRIAHAWYNLGLYYKNSADAGAAVEAFRRVTEIDPNDADTWYFLGSTYAQLKQFPEAIAAFEHALKLDPQHASAQFGLARAYQQSGQARSGARGDEEVSVHHAEQAGLAHQPGLWGTGKVFAGGRVADGAWRKLRRQIPVRFVDVTKEAGIETRTKARQICAKRGARLRSWCMFPRLRQ